MKAIFRGARFGGEMGDTLARILRTVRMTLSYALPLLAFDLVRVWMGGRQFLEKWHLTIGGILLFYFFGATSVGVLIGLFLPLVRNRAGAAILGTIALLPANYFLLRVLLPDEQDRIAVLGLTIFLSVLYGSLGGIYFGQKLLPATDSDSTGTSSRAKTLVYGMALGTALVLLWLDLRFRIINK